MAVQANMLERQKEYDMELVVSEIEVMLVERRMRPNDVGLYHHMNLRLLKIPCSALSQDNVKMLKRMSEMPFIASLDAAFTRVADFETLEIASSHGVTKDTEQFMNMLGVHMTVQDAVVKYNSKKHEDWHSFHPKNFKTICKGHEYHKWKVFYDAAQVFEIDESYGEPQKPVSPGFSWTLKIVAHAYPFMCHEQYLECDEKDEDYKYCTKLLKDCPRFSNTSGDW